MSNIIEFEALQKMPKFKEAEELLEDILSGRVPEMVLLESLYGPNAQNVLAIILHFQKSNKKLNLRKIRKNPRILEENRLRIEANTDYQMIQYSLLEWTLPSQTMLKKMFGKYSKTVGESYKIFLESKKTRKCGISLSAHHNRVAGLTYQLTRDHKYAAIAALHDIIEDMLTSAKDKHKEPYSLHRYDEFVERFIPKELQRSVIILTNHYDLIIKYVDHILEKEGKRLTKEALSHYLKSSRWGTLNRYVEAIEKILESELFIHDQASSFYSQIKWVCYNLYSKEIIESGVDDPNLIIIKLLDISDNARGYDAVDMTSKLKNVRKQMASVEKARKTIDDKKMNAYLDEAEEDSLTCAKYYVLRDLMQDQLVLDFIAVALKKIDVLKDVFYR